MHYALILATVGRTDEVERLLASLARQTYRRFELTVVDQNDDDRLRPVLGRFEGAFAIRRIRSSRGLSRARNAALPDVRADVVAFPDDDCWYPPGLLERVTSALIANPDWDGLAGRAVDTAGVASAGRWDEEGGPITRYNVWRRAISFSIFLRAPLVAEIGAFDESLGVGAGTSLGSGEETDYLLRALERGARLVYDPALEVLHPDPLAACGPAIAARGYSYGRGIGHVLRRHRYPWWFTLYFAARPLGGAVVASLNRRPGHARYHLNVFRGRMRGWLR